MRRASMSTACGSGFTSVMDAQLSRMKLGIDAAEFGLSWSVTTGPKQRELEGSGTSAEFSTRPATTGSSGSG